MYTASALAALLAAAHAVSAFKGTSPVVALASDQGLFSLASLGSPSSSSSAVSSSSSQKTFSSPSSDALCHLSTLLVVSAPGLHYSDLALLPSAADSPAGAKAALAHFGSSESTGEALTIPYVVNAKGRKTGAERLIRRFVDECGARVVGENEANVWAGEGRTVEVVKVEGLQEYELTGAEERAGRKAIISEIDDVFSSLTPVLPGPFAVVLTSLPSAASLAAPAGASLVAHQKRGDYSRPKPLKWKRPSKRQEITDAVEEEYVDELLDEIAKEDALEEMYEKMEQLENAEAAAPSSSLSTGAAPVANEEYAAASNELGVTDVADPTVGSSDSKTLSELETEEYAVEDPYTSDAWDGESLLDVSPYQDEDGGNNGTSIFQPKEKSGLLHRYVFFTPALIFALLVSLLVLIPTLLIGVQALTSIETVHGLETKMAGTVGLDAAKA
ncbi:hypothetical protein JCM10213_003779 [Rhodosporidiobolus nylandii]